MRSQRELFFRAASLGHADSLKVLKQLGVLVLCLVTFLGRGEIRIGLLSTESSIDSSVDLLTASLSGLTNVVLLERAEVQKLFHEQALSFDGKPDPTRLGQLLRADGLVLMQTIQSPEGPNLALRLVAVNSGVILDSAMYRLPIDEPVTWGKMVTARFGPLLQKLEVKRENAIPISLVNLHSSVSTPLSLQVERSLSTLLFHRLMSERDLFVLERRQMGKLSWEKSLPGPDDKPFWNGAYLLEGVIDRDGVDRDVLTVHARLSAPDKGKTIEIKAFGPRKDPVKVVEKLALEIVAALQRQVTVTSWDPDAEAARYEREAAWNLAWGNWKEGYIAADSAYH